MCTRHPNLVSSAFYAIPIFHIIIRRIFNLLVKLLFGPIRDALCARYLRTHSETTPSHVKPWCRSIRICKPCYRNIERLSKIRAELSSLEAKVDDNLKKRADLEPSISQGHEESTEAGSHRRRSRGTCTVSTPTRVRRRSKGTPDSPSSRKRRRVDTPTRRALLSLQPFSDSPLVAVSSPYYYH